MSVVCGVGVGGFALLRECECEGEGRGVCCLSKVVLPVNGPMSQSRESVSKSGVSGPVTRGWGGQVLDGLAMGGWLRHHKMPCRFLMMGVGMGDGDGGWGWVKGNFGVSMSPTSHIRSVIAPFGSAPHSHLYFRPSHTPPFLSLFPRPLVMPDLGCVFRPHSSPCRAAKGKQPRATRRDGASRDWTRCAEASLRTLPEGNRRS